MRQGNLGNHEPFDNFLIRGSGAGGGRGGVRAPSPKNPVLEKEAPVGVGVEISGLPRQRGNLAGLHAKVFQLRKATYLRLGGRRLWCRMLESAGTTI